MILTLRLPNFSSNSLESKFLCNMIYANLIVNKCFVVVKAILKTVSKIKIMFIICKLNFRFS